MPKLRHGRQAAFDRQSLGKAQASAGCFPLHLNSQPCWSRENALLAQASAGRLDNTWLILYRFWTRLLQCDSWWFKTRFIKVRKPGQVKDFHLGLNSTHAVWWGWLMGTWHHDPGCWQGECKPCSFHVYPCEVKFDWMRITKMAGFSFTWLTEIWLPRVGLQKQFNMQETKTNEHSLTFTAFGASSFTMSPL